MSGDLVYCDDSGDPGTKIDTGSSAFFLVTAVVFQSEEKAAACDVSVESVRARFRFPETAEFHFTKSSRKVREEFLRTIASQDFFYLSLVMDKRKIPPKLIGKPSDFYAHVAETTMGFLVPHLADASVEIDKGGSQSFGRNLCKRLARIAQVKDGAAPKPIRRAKMTDSKQRSYSTGGHDKRRRR